MSQSVINIKQGKIKGTRGSDLDGGRFYKFLGIPFAKPPIGPLRFKAPQPAEPWEDILDCTKERNCPLSFELMLNQIVGSEDCLYLNVFTRQLPRSGSALKPVMVYIPAGGFTLGSGSENMQGPKHLLTEDIVLVVFNYRVGVFGFLSTDDPSLDIPGNAGLKDQTLALKWVQVNIASFNGDPNNVTLFGISAGGASVIFQMLSPTAKGLFHKAIAQSGTPLMPWTWGQRNAILIAEKLGKKVYTEKEAIEILTKVPGKELWAGAMKIQDSVTNCARRPYGPIIEKPNPTAFLTQNPLDLLASGRYHQVPLIQGITSNEGLVYDSYSFGPPEPVKPGMGIEWCLGIEKGSEKYKKVEELCRDFYFSNGLNKEGAYKCYSDVVFLNPTLASIKLTVKTSAHPVYFYIYAREVDLSNIMRRVYGIQDESIRGVGHVGDQMVIFDHMLIKLYNIEMTEENMDAAKQIVRLWTNFARTGRPHENWEPVTDLDNIKYFEIDKDATLKTNPFAERVTFWDNIYKDIVPNFNPYLDEKRSE